MPRRRHGTIHESRQDLIELQRRVNGREEETRIRMLLLLQEDESRTMAQAATLIPCSERSVRRWWNAYREGGLEALLAHPLDAAMTKQIEIVPRPATGKSSSRIADPTQQPDEPRAVPIHISNFLNSLPLMADPVEWVKSFRETLRTFLGDVDRITINVDIYSEGDGGHGEDPSTFVTEHVGARSRARSNPSSMVHRNTGAQGKQIVETMLAGDFPGELFHPPLVIDYFTANGLYVGSLIHWRDVTQKPISNRTLRTLKQLEPFLVFLLSDCAARCRQKNPNLKVFTEIVTVIRDREGLAPRQQDVLLQHLLGKGNAEIAKALGIAVCTVRKHIDNIYRKTGVGNLNELVARAFGVMG